MIKIPVCDYFIEGEISKKEGSSWGIVLSHGANNNMDNDLIRMLFHILAKYYNVLRFNFSFVDSIKEKNLEVNINELNAAIRLLSCNNIVLIGKSYGARLSALSAAHSDVVKNAIFLGYPMRKGKINQWELKQLVANYNKFTFIIGSRDPLFDFAYFEKEIPQAKLIKIQGGDHSFKGTSKEETRKKMQNVSRVVLDEISAITGMGI